MISAPFLKLKEARANKLADDPEFPYTIDEWMRDVIRWSGATKITQERQGPLVS